MKVRASTSRRRPHKRYRLLISAAVGLTAAAMLAACGGSSGNSSTSNAVTLSLFTCQQCAPFPWQISDFEAANPNIHIKVDSVPFGQFYAKTSVLAASDSPPDLFTVDQPTIANLAAGHVIMPLDNLLSASYVDSLTSAARADFSYNGKIYSPGPIDTALALFYNKTYLDKAGITAPSSLDSTWTWQQAADAMLKCQQANSTSSERIWGLAPSVFGNGTPGSDYYSTLFLRSEGTKTGAGQKTFEGISPDGTTVDGYINSPQAVQGAQFFQDMFQKMKISPTTGIPNAFVDGKACFDMNGSTDIDTLASAKVHFQWGVTPWPYFQTPIVHNGSTEVAIGAKTTHVKQALQFINFVSSPAQQTKMVTKTGYLPVIASLYKTDKALDTAPWDIFVNELAEWGAPRPVTPHYLQFSQIVTNAMRDIADGSSVAGRLNQAVQQLDPLLKQPAGAL